ncbi:MAG: NUDIX domain-containing protein [Comamonadaceae bacterium]|nr:MAG: NUDIX domain-containing protein [Comamonadaceae bacterium]
MAAPPWLAAAREAALRGPSAPRDALQAGGETVGSIAGEVAELICRQRLLDKRYELSPVQRDGQTCWALSGGDPTSALNALAHALRAADRCGPWRDEQLAVCNAQGGRVGTIERGAVRVLGLRTQAVHLVGATADGSALWVQQRAFTKPNNPGMWDTLMGGMVSAADTVPQALERETWEEAGLRMDELQSVVHGGHVDFARPSREAGGTGYMVERIDWFHAIVPDGLTPQNQDGEVERFERLPHADVMAQLAQGAFTAEAALVLAGFYGW